MFAWRRSAPKVPVSTLYRRKSCACTQPVCIFLENDLVCKKEQLYLQGAACLYAEALHLYGEDSQICTDQLCFRGTSIHLYRAEVALVGHRTII